MTQTKRLPREIEIALMREASMSSMAIGTGLTHIRQYDFARYGFFYSGLLSFTAGIERLLKIILIYDYRLNNGDAFPNNKHLKALHHNLDTLIEKAREISKSQSLNLDDSFFDQDLLYRQIVPFLTDFAVQARYYNLDYLTGKKQAGAEPLTRWDKEICEEIINRHYRPNQRKRERIERLGKELDAFGATIWHTHEDGTDINGGGAFIMHGELIPTKQKYSMYYLYTIARFFSNLCAGLEEKGNFYPYLREFFLIFRINDKSQVLGKKIWNPM